VWYWFACVSVALLLRLLARLEIRGLENFPLHGPAILVANHIHLFDPPVLGAVLPRVIIFLAKRELFHTPVLNWIVSHYKALPLRRGEPDRQALRRALVVLRNGGVIGIFPEGTRSRTGALQRGQPGVVYLAARSGAPIVPVAIEGTDRFQFPALWRRPLVRISIGRPFTLPAELLRRDRWAEATDFIMLRLAALLPPERRGVYAPALVGDSAHLVR